MVLKSAFDGRGPGASSAASGDAPGPIRATVALPFRPCAGALGHVDGCQTPGVPPVRRRPRAEAPHPRRAARRRAASTTACPRAWSLRLPARVSWADTRSRRAAGEARRRAAHAGGPWRAPPVRLMPRRRCWSTRTPAAAACRVILRTAGCMRAALRRPVSRIRCGRSAAVAAGQREVVDRRGGAMAQRGRQAQTGARPLRHRAHPARSGPEGGHRARPRRLGASASTRSSSGAARRRRARDRPQRADRGRGHGQWGRTPLLTRRSCTSGFDLIVYPVAAILADARGRVDVFAALRRDGSTAGVMSRMLVRVGEVPAAQWDSGRQRDASAPPCRSSR